jgi:hypothetical protein
MEGNHLAIIFLFNKSQTPGPLIEDGDMDTNPRAL